MTNPNGPGHNLKTLFYPKKNQFKNLRRTWKLGKSMSNAQAPFKAS